MNVEHVVAINDAFWRPITEKVAAMILEHRPEWRNEIDTMVSDFQATIRHHKLTPQEYLVLADLLLYTARRNYAR